MILSVSHSGRIRPSRFAAGFWSETRLPPAPRSGHKQRVPALPVYGLPADQSVLVRYRDYSAAPAGWPARATVQAHARWLTRATKEVMRRLVHFAGPRADGSVTPTRCRGLACSTYSAHTRRQLHSPTNASDA